MYIRCHFTLLVQRRLTCSWASEKSLLDALVHHNLPFLPGPTQGPSNTRVHTHTQTHTTHMGLSYLNIFWQWFVLGQPQSKQCYHSNDGGEAKDDQYVFGAKCLQFRLPSIFHNWQLLFSSSLLFIFQPLLAVVGLSKRGTQGTEI